MLIFSVSYQFYRMIPEGNPKFTISKSNRPARLLLWQSCPSFHASRAHTGVPHKTRATQTIIKQSCTHSCYQRSQAPIQTHALPSACRAESCLLCCQPEPSLSQYLPEYHGLLHDSLADCKLKGDELSTWMPGHSSNSCATLLSPQA